MTTPKEIKEQRLTTEESLFRAAEGLAEAATEARDSPGLVPGIHRALRECVLAVEYHLDTISGKQGAGAVRGDAPRLLSELERLEAALAGCLVQVWEAKSSSTEPTSKQLSDMRKLAGALRSAASTEFELVHEAVRPLGDMD